MSHGDETSRLGGFASRDGVEQCFEENAAEERGKIVLERSFRIEVPADSRAAEPRIWLISGLLLFLVVLIWIVGPHVVPYIFQLAGL